MNTYIDWHNPLAVGTEVWVTEVTDIRSEEYRRLTELCSRIQVFAPELIEVMGHNGDRVYVNGKQLPIRLTTCSAQNNLVVQLMLANRILSNQRVYLGSALTEC